MTGFFLVDKRSLDLGRLRPRGFKVLLEITASHPDSRRGAPVHVRRSSRGREQSSVFQGIEFARQLVALRLKPAGRSKWVYDVHGLVGVESDRALPELERFLVRSAPMAPSISVRVACTADMPLGESVNLMRDVPTVSYRERTGFAMSLSVGPTTSR